MVDKQKKSLRTLEIMLIVLVLGMTCLFLRMGGHKMVVLNLFFLPIVLSGYYLGRTSAGTLALFSALAVMIISMMDSTGMAAFNSPAMVYLALTVWAAVLGLTAILVGTLCEERAAKVEELQEAYVGVVEVLSKYLQSDDVQLQNRSANIADLSRRVAERLKLSRKETDDIRVGVLLCDLGNVEITTRLISRALSSLQSDPGAVAKRTFLGVELVHSLGSVLHSVVPLLVNHLDALRGGLSGDAMIKAEDIPISVRIIAAVRAYDALVNTTSGSGRLEPAQAITELRREADCAYDPEVLDALERLETGAAPAPREPALV